MDGAPPEGNPDRLDLRSLVSHSRSVPASMTVEALQAVLAQGDVDYIAVVDADRLLGLCSRRRLAQELSTRYGFALFARQPVTSFLMPAPLLVAEDTPITEVFQSASGREAGGFYDDVALVDGLGRYLGMIPMLTLVRLQTEFLIRNNARLEASRIEIAVKNRVLEDDLEMARKVQLAMQPQTHAPLTAHGLTLSLDHRYRPSGGVSGDLFDVLRIGSHSAGVLVCDVMGHGVRSALITAMIRAMLEELQPVAAEPGAFLTRLNRDLARILHQSDGLIFVTAAYSVIDLRSGLIRYALAGHPTPLRWDARTRRVRPLTCPPDAAGPALGLIGDYEFAAVEEPFASGDRFAAFTDGLFEAADPAGEEFGIERLAQALGRSAHLPLGEALDAVMTAVAAFSGGSFGDDVCVIAADLKTA